MLKAAYQVYIPHPWDEKCAKKLARGRIIKTVG
jgi:hypothetical protein